MVGTEATMGLSLWSATGKHELAWSTHLQGSLLCLQLLLQTDKLYFDGISTQPALYYEKAYFIVEPGWFLWGFIKWNPSWEIAQPLTHIDPQKQIPPSSHQTIFYLFHPIISINHPPTSSHPFILLPPPPLPLPPQSSCSDPLENSWIKLVALRHCLLSLGCMVRS